MNNKTNYNKFIKINIVITLTEFLLVMQIRIKDRCSIQWGEKSYQLNWYVVNSVFAIF